MRSENPRAITRAVENEIQTHGHEYAVSAQTLAETSDQALVEDRATAVLSNLFAGLALMLAGIGLFGLVSYTVSSRTREIGIRMAMGAEPDGILRLILGESIVLTGMGIMVGIPCALAATRFIAHMLFGVTPADPLAFAVAAATLGAIRAAAGYWPARRAARIDPMEALHSR